MLETAVSNNSATSTFSSERDKAQHIVLGSVTAFTKKSLLLTSAGQKLFSCHMCNTSFSTKGSLKVHMRLHTGSKPFKCPFCELRFRTSGHRKTHIQCHFRANSDSRKSKRVASSAGQASHNQDPRTGQVVAPVQRPAASEALQPVGLLQAANSDPNIYLPANQVLAGQFDQGLLQPGLVGQAILPASMSGRIVDGSVHVPSMTERCSVCLRTLILFTGKQKFETKTRL